MPAQPHTVAGRSASALGHHDRAEDTARALSAALEHHDGLQAFTISGDYDQNRLSLAKAKRLLGWEPLARPGQQ